MATIISVSNAEELMNALASATGGDTIELAKGDYGQLNLLTFKTFGVKAVYDTPVTITSVDPDERASFSGIDLQGVENLTFDNVVFDSNYTGSALWVAPFRISDSTGITIRNSLFQGELASGTGDPTIDGFATGKGLTIERGSDIVIENNEFTTWHRALTVGGATDVTVTGNDVHSIRSDGLNFAHVQNVVIEGNYIHDFMTSTASGDHADMIQFWTNGGTTPSADIVIRGNTLDVGDGGETQSIFMRNDMVDLGLAGEEMFYRNILIEENVILNNHVHGITVGETDGLIIRKNSVLDADASITATVATPKINVASQSKNVMIEWNAAADISGYIDQSDWTLSSNARIQNGDPNGAGYYETEFLNSSMSGDVNDYRVDPNGTIAQLGAGASRLRLDPAPENLQTTFDVSNNPNEESHLVFDASHTYGPTGKVSDSDAQFIWDFGDGAGATGQVVRHAYADAGRYETTLTVVMPDGTIAKASTEVAIMGADVLSYDPQTGLFQAEGYGTATAIEDSDKASVALGGSQGVDLGDSGTQISIGKEHLSRLFGASSFDMSMTLRSDTLGSAGEVARVHDHFILSVTTLGEVSFQFWSDTQFVGLTATGVTINDGIDHNIRISFDGASSNLMIYVDGQLGGAAEVAGAVRGDNPRGLDFGNPWGKDNFDGTLTAFELEVSKQDFPDYQGDLAALSGDVIPVDEVPGIDTTTEDISQPETKVDDPVTTDPINLDDGDTPTGETTTQDRTDVPIDSEPTPPDEPLYTVDFTQAGTTESRVKLFDDAHVVQNADGSAKVVLDGKRDFVELGRVEALEDSQQLNVSLNFQRSDVEGGSERMVWNHEKFGITLQGDSLLIHVGNKDQLFNKAFEISNAGIGDTEEHSLNVALDAEADRLQVVLDGEVVLDERDTDLDFVGAGGYEWGWSIGTAWNRFYEGSVSEFALDDQAIFVDDAITVL